MLDFLMFLPGKTAGSPFGHFAGLLGSGILGTLNSFFTPYFENHASAENGGSSTGSSSSGSSGSAVHSDSPNPSTGDTGMTLSDVVGNNFSDSATTNPETLTLADVVGD